MARMDLHRNLGGNGYLLDIQADLLRSFNSRVVLPVLSLYQAPPLAGRLNPLVVIDGAEHSVVTQHMAAVSIRLLGETVMSMASRETEITGAIDLLISGI